MRKGTPKTNYATEYNLTDDEDKILRGIFKGVSTEMLKVEEDKREAILTEARKDMIRFIAVHISPRLKDVDPSKHKYSIKYNPTKKTIKLRRVVQNREITTSNVWDVFGWGNKVPGKSKRPF